MESSECFMCRFLFCGGQAWAVASGKINEFPNDKARWKTNFRCALNNLSVRFKMLQDNSKNSEDPHKIYEIVNTEREWKGSGSGSGGAVVCGCGKTN